jgi:hypothetical protein
MSDERDKKEDPAEELKQGLSHLWKAARGVATEVKKEVERTDFGRELSGAGREFVRAAANVVDRIADEVSDLAKPKKPGDPPDDAPVKDDAPAKQDGEEDDFDGVKPKPREGGASPDPGFRIVVDDAKPTDPDEKKK